MIIRAMFIGFIIGALIGLFTTGVQGALSTGFIFAIFAVPIRKWLFRTFWH